MKIVILPTASGFTNTSKKVWAVISWNRFFRTLIPCICMPASIGKFLTTTVCSRNDFLTPFTTPGKREPCSSKPCWIVAGTRASTGESFIKLISKFRAFAALHLRVKPAKNKTQFRPARQKTTRPRFFLSLQWRGTKMPSSWDCLRFAQFATPVFHHFPQCTYSRLNRVRGSFSSPGWPMAMPAMGMTDAGN